MPACLRCATQLAPGAGFCPHCGTAIRAMSEPATWEGQIIDGRYAIRHRIGAGGSGTVYVADHIHLGKKVALKALHKDLLADDMALERFRREATMVGTLTNPHIVQILDYGRLADGRVYLAMEYLEGESLESMLHRLGRVSIDQTIDVLLQACDALGEAHSVGYVHRDLRPKNLFLTIRPTESNFLKILDFGLAKAVDANQVAASTNLGLTFGDPRYMSPEQAKGAQVDRRSDLYQLGCVAYEMLTGAPPFLGHGVFDVLAKHAKEAPAPITNKRGDVPSGLEDCVLRLLAKSPDARFATAFQLADALRPLQSAPTAAAFASEPAPSIMPTNNKHTAPAGDHAVTAAAVNLAVAQHAQQAQQVPYAQPMPSQAVAASAPAVTPAVGIAPASTAPANVMGTSQAWYQAGDQLAGDASLSSSLAHKSYELGSSVSLLIAARKRRQRRLVAIALLASAAIAAGIVMLVISGNEPPRSGAAIKTPAPTLPSLPLVTDPSVVPTMPATTHTPAASPPLTSATAPATAPATSSSTPKAKPSAASAQPIEPPPPSQPLTTESAPTSNQEDVSTLLQRAEIALVNGDFDGATSRLKLALAQAPNSSLAHVLMGEVRLSQGAFESAADAFKQALQLDPDNARARRGYTTAESRIAPPTDDEPEEPLPSQTPPQPPSQPPQPGNESPASVTPPAAEQPPPLAPPIANQ